MLAAVLVWVAVGLGVLSLGAVTGCQRGGAPRPPAGDGSDAPAGDGGETALMPRPIKTPSGTAMLVLRGGKAVIGSDQGPTDEAPLHHVTVDPFAMDQFEVTQQQYAQLQLPNPSHFKGEQRPVEQVRWSDAALFCNERSRQDGLDPCYDEATFECNFDATGYRLPTEAEWEYAARAGDHRDSGEGSVNLRELDKRACYAGSSADRTAPVGRHEPNRWGFHDLLGNVAEWCHDVYDPNYYASSPIDNPRGPQSGEKRVVRGGSWKSDASQCRASARSADDPGISDACFARNIYGFRCVRKLTSAERELATDAGPIERSGTP